MANGGRTPPVRPPWQRLAAAAFFGLVAYVLAIIVLVVVFSNPREPAPYGGLIALIAGIAVAYYFFRRL